MLEIEDKFLKTLIIKSNGNSFERYFSNNMKRKSVDIGDVKESYGKVETLRKILNKLQITPLYTFWLNNWKYHIKEYDTVIIFDYVLSLSLVKWIRSKNKNCVIKIWLWNIPTFEIEPFKKYATLYCFDKNYAKNNNIKFVEQFYIPKKSSVKDDKKGVVYIGYDKDRYKKLKFIAQELQKNQIYYHFNLQRNPENSYLDNESDIKLIDKPIDYEQVVDISNMFNTILELNISGQSGLTLRTMEALFYHKKLITNNENVKNFPFYNKNNFYVLGKETRSIKSFIDGSFQKVDDQLLSKYTYEKWLNNIMEDF